MSLDSQPSGQEVDRFKGPLDQFVDHAMYIGTIRSKPLSKVRQDFENLIAAVYVYSRQQLLDEIRKKQNEEQNTTYLPDYPL